MMSVVLDGVRLQPVHWSLRSATSSASHKNSRAETSLGRLAVAALGGYIPASLKALYSCQATTHNAVSSEIDDTKKHSQMPIKATAGGAPSSVAIGPISWMRPRKPDETTKIPQAATSQTVAVSSKVSREPRQRCCKQDPIVTLNNTGIAPNVAMPSAAQLSMWAVHARPAGAAYSLMAMQRSAANTRRAPTQQRARHRGANAVSGTSSSHRFLVREGS